MRWRPRKRNEERAVPWGSRSIYTFQRVCKSRMRRTKEDAARTRAAIMEAALSCFDRHGIAGSTMAQIAAAAHVTKGAVYHHFGGKREILHELREAVSLPLLDEADTELLQARGLPALERVEHFLLRILDALEHDQ